MFGLFRKKKPSYSITDADKIWVEQTFEWMIKTFGLDHLKEAPFILPTVENFPYNDLHEPEQFKELFERICHVLEIDSEEIEVRIFDDEKMQKWTTADESGRLSTPGGLFFKSASLNQKAYNVRLTRSLLKYPQLLIITLAHELTHVKLLGGEYLHEKDPNMEPLTDLACIYFGFGIFIANTRLMNDRNWISSAGYLPIEVIAYANATLCHITHQDAEVYEKTLNLNTRSIFLGDYEYLQTTGDTLLSPARVAELERYYTLQCTIQKGFITRKFEDAVSAGHELLTDYPGEKKVYNDIGYAFLLSKNYDTAARWFTKAIELDPFYQEAFSNRGYCYLQLGKLEDAHADLESCVQMELGNSTSWRNVGVYCLMTKDAKTALTYFEGAQKFSRKTELIHFYLGHAHYTLGDIEKAKIHFAKSKELNEHNDSVLEIISFE